MTDFIGHKPVRGVEPQPVSAPLEGVLEQCPAIWQYLTVDKWSDGTKRQTSTISVFCEHGSLKVALNDRGASRSCFVTGTTVEEALVSLELRLQEGTTEWRGWKRAK